MNEKLVAIDSGERLTCFGETNDGVITSAGIMPWDCVEGFFCWSGPLGRYLFIPR